MNTTEKVGYTWHKIYIVGRKLHILSLLQPFPTHIRKQMSHSRDIWHYYKNSYNSKNYAIRLSTLQTIAIRLHRLTAILRCLVRQLFFMVLDSIGVPSFWQAWLLFVFLPIVLCSSSMCQLSFQIKMVKVRLKLRLCRK